MANKMRSAQDYAVDKKRVEVRMEKDCIFVQTTET